MQDVQSRDPGHDWPHPPLERDESLIALEQAWWDGSHTELEPAA